MTEHVKRGAKRRQDREVEYDALADEPINSVWCCTECGDPLELRQRQGHVNYVEVGCSCGAATLSLRIADLLEFEMPEWDTETVASLGRGEFQND